MSAGFHLAPPPKTVGGLLAVPIDIQSVQAVFTFDGASQTAVADATMAYRVGPTAGNPFFDLRQTISEAWLDGAAFPPAQLAHHPFGAGAFTDLRVIHSVQAAGSAHTLRVKYTLALPNSEMIGYVPALEWTPGPRLRFVFGLSDLRRARYAEAWLPANLIFDQFAITLELKITGTGVAHSVITNGTATPLGANHWSIQYPARFTALSPMLEVRAADTLVQQSGSVSLPVSGKTVTIEAWKPAESSVALAGQIDDIKALLAGIETGYGPYLHDERFVAFFNGSGGMEYEGGTTTSTDALAHETFHSWFARGIKPASQADGWWDEGFTRFHDDGADDAQPFDFTDPPVLLCSRDPWQRHTPMSSYEKGSEFFRGVAALLGIGPLNGWMRELYDAHRGNPVSTAMIEEFLLCRSGDPRVVDAFHRFVYGLPDPSPAPDLWLRDTPAHTGADAWSGAFWDSPDLWIRNGDDGGTEHQAPEYGRDNWFHARVRNRGAGHCAHFVVTFHTRGFAGTEFVFPADFLPCTAAAAGFDLPAGAERVVRARWPKALVPPEGTHTCLLASVIARTDQPVAGRHVWEHNNLAQKNLTVVDLIPDEFMIIPVVIGNGLGGPWSGVELEVWHPPTAPVDLTLIHRSRHFFGQARAGVRELVHLADAPKAGHAGGEMMDCGGHVPGRGADKRSILTSRRPELIASRFPGAWEAAFGKGGRLRVQVPPRAQAVAGFKVAVPRRARTGESFKVHLVQRDAATRQVVGGIAVQVNVRAG